jgi:hypothetical protein
MPAMLNSLAMLALRAIDDDENARGGAEPLLRVGSPRFPLALPFRIKHFHRVFKRAVALSSRQPLPYGRGSEALRKAFEILTSY